jgi:hypothetical protein
MAYTPATLSVPKGGTGQPTLTLHGLLVGEGTAAVNQLVAGTSGQVIQSGGASADPLWSTATYPSTASTVGTILTSNGTNWVNTFATYPTSIGANQLLVASSNNAITPLATANSSVLTTNSSGVPGFTAKTAVGNLVLIQTQTASGSASIIFTTGITTTYNNYKLIISNYVPANNSVNLLLQYSSNGGSSYITTGYLSDEMYSAYNNASGLNTGFSATTGVILNLSVANTATTGSPGEYTFYQLTSGYYPSMMGMHTRMDGLLCVNGSVYNTGIVVNALKISCSAGNIATGTFSLYGIVQ